MQQEGNAIGRKSVLNLRRLFSILTVSDEAQLKIQELECRVDKKDEGLAAAKAAYQSLRAENKRVGDLNRQYEQVQKALQRKVREQEAEIHRKTGDNSDFTGIIMELNGRISDLEFLLELREALDARSD